MHLNRPLDPFLEMPRLQKLEFTGTRSSGGGRIGHWTPNALKMLGLAQNRIFGDAAASWQEAHQPHLLRSANKRLQDNDSAPRDSAVPGLGPGTEDNACPLPFTVDWSNTV